MEEGDDTAVVECGENVKSQKRACWHGRSDVKKGPSYGQALLRSPGISRAQVCWGGRKWVVKDDR
jgi:hypothetical protein